MRIDRGTRSIGGFYYKNIKKELEKYCALRSGSGVAERLFEVIPNKNINPFSFILFRDLKDVRICNITCIQNT